MFLFDLEFHPDLRRVEAEDFEQEIGWFLAALYRNGQTLEGWTTHWTSLSLRVRVEVPAEDALDFRHFSEWGWKSYHKVIVALREPALFRPVGRVTEKGPPCRCPRPSRFILTTSYLSNSPPVRCGDCFEHVPLFRLPFLRDETEHASILNWRSDYQACDALWMGSSIGEVFGYRQLSHVRSELTAQGRRICSELTLRTGRPFYYFLVKYHSPEERLCPGCGGAWELAESVRYLDYRCDACRLVSERPKDSGPLRLPRRLRREERRE